jgi:hypothetical protein
VEEQLEATTRATTDGEGTSGGGKGGFFLSVWDGLSAFHGFREKKYKKLKMKNTFCVFF